VRSDALRPSASRARLSILYVPLPLPDDVNSPGKPAGTPVAGFQFERCRARRSPSMPSAVSTGAAANAGSGLGRPLYTVTSGATRA